MVEARLSRLQHRLKRFDDLAAEFGVVERHLLNGDRERQRREMARSRDALLGALAQTSNAFLSLPSGV